MATNIFVNLPVKDLKQSMEFFGKLGYRFNPQFTNDDAACMVISDTIYAMLLTEKFFSSFIDKPISDAKKSTEVLLALSVDSKDEVNQLVEKALAAGARRYKEPKDQGFMYDWGYEDLDGHIWEIVWMDASFVQK